MMGHQGIMLRLSWPGAIIVLQAVITARLGVCTPGEVMHLVQNSTPPSSQPAIVTPSVYWVSKPVLPGETLLVAGAGLGGATATFCIDPACHQPVQNFSAAPSAWDQSVQATVPATRDHHFICSPTCFLRILGSGGGTVNVQVNAPDVAWSPMAEVGGLLRVFGRSLAWHADRCVDSARTPTAVPTTKLRFCDSVGHTTAVPSASANCYEASFRLPQAIPPGMHNFTVETSWGASETFAVLITDKIAAPTSIDVEKEHGGNLTAAVQAAGKLSSIRPIRVQLGGKLYFLTETIELPNNTALVGNVAGGSVLEFALALDSVPACHPSGNPVHPGHRCDSQGVGCDCLISAVFGAGNQWGIHNLTLVLSSSPPGAAALWLPPSSSGAKITGLDIQLLQDNITNNAVYYQGAQFEFGHNTITQVGKCWYNGPNNGAHQWGGTNKAAMIADGARGGWIHHNKIYWNCGGWGILDKSERIVLEDNHMQCTEPNNLTNGVIEGGSGMPMWDGYRQVQSRFWSVARNNFSRPVMNGACTNATGVPGNPLVNCSEEDGAHQNWKQRETLTTDGSGEFGHGFITEQHGASVTMRWSALVQTPFPSASLIIIAGNGLGQRRFITAYNNLTSTVTVDRPFDQYVDSESMVAAVNTVGEKNVVGNRFDWTEVVQVCRSCAHTRMSA